MTLSELYRNTKTALKRADVEAYEFEAVQLLRSVGIEKTALITEPEREADENISREIRSRVERRILGEPLQYILGEWEFYGLTFKVGKGVLIPRQDTETLVDVALEFLRGRGKNARRTIDLCAGTGCIGIVLSKLADAYVMFDEKYYAADGYLRRNLKLHGVPLEACMFDACIEDMPFCGFDLVVCNPPYLSREDLRNLQKEVTFEPVEALYGGEDGLDFYRRIIPIYTPRLFQGGMLAMEIGKGQEEAVCELFGQSGLNPQTKPDANGVIRVVYAIRE